MGRCPLALLLLLVVSVPAFAAEPTATLRGKVTVYVISPTGERTRKADHSGVVVYVPGFTQPAPAEPVEIAQKNIAFTPVVQPIVAGQKVNFVNQDAVVHNVFSRSPARKFDLGKTRPGDKAMVEFPKPGVLEVYCDIHETMASTVLVLPNRAYAITGKDGTFELSGVPGGKFVVYAYHRQADPVKAEVTFAPNKTAKVKFELIEVKPVVEEHLDKYGRKYRARSKGY